MALEISIYLKNNPLVLVITSSDIFFDVNRMHLGIL